MQETPVLFFVTLEQFSGHGTMGGPFRSDKPSSFELGLSLGKRPNMSS